MHVLVWDILCVCMCLCISITSIHVAVVCVLCARVFCATEQLKSDRYSQALVSSCQGWSENSAKLLLALFWAKMHTFGCRLEFKEGSKWIEATCKSQRLIASGSE